MPADRPNDYQPFPVTPWSLVGRAVNATVESRRESLGQLLFRYMPALRAHLILKKRFKPDRADDILQGFIADKVVAQETIAYADRERGKFRTFLCTALDHYAVSQIRHDRAKKRAPGEGVADIDEAPEAAHPDSTPADSFDVEWARTVVTQTMDQMRAECEKSDRADVWQIFDARVIGPTIRGEDPPDYETLVARTGAASPLQLSNLLVTAKRMFIRTLRDVVSEYARDEEELEEEIRDLRKILGAAGV
ncbi:sigma factor [soil metagenome]